MAQETAGGLPNWVTEFYLKTNVDEKTVKEVYEKFSNSYDQISKDSGYEMPSYFCNFLHLVAKRMAQDVNPFRILDVGAGTGLVGNLLRDFGYLNIDALDCCDEMLSKAKDKKIYQNYLVGFVDEKRFASIEDGMYNAIASCGAISGPQIQARAFNEMLRWLKKGGIFCFTLRVVDMEDASLGYKEKFDELVEKKVWSFVSRKVFDYYKYPGRSENILQKAYVCVYKKEQ